jgi:predicted outer membrane repeat protein
MVAVMGLSPPSSGDTVIPGGAVYGTWSAAGSPYHIEGDISVPADSTLVIEPGVRAVFQEDCGLTVTGSLSAVGTAQDSITFTAPEPAEWNGILVEEVAGPVQLFYCIVEHGAATGTLSHRNGGGLWIASSSISIANSTFRHNRSIGWGGAVYLYNHAAPPAALTDCLFSNNQAEQNGGGLYFGGQDLELTGCRFVDNTSDIMGGGAYCEPWLFGSVLVDMCYFEGNGASEDGGGLMVHGGARNGVTVRDCEFIWNDAVLKGGGIRMKLTDDVTIEDCVFRENSHGDLGSAAYLDSGTSVITGSTFDRSLANGAGALCCDGTDAEVVSCTFSSNWADGDGMDLRLTNGTVSILNTVVSGTDDAWPYASLYCGTGTFSVEYCDLFQRTNGDDFAGAGIPAGLGDLVGVNAVGDACDAYSNIPLDPFFCDRENGDLRIAEDSPCLGAGEGGVDIGAHGIGCETLVRPTTWGGVKAMFR